jgi:outer membrane receptor protein involved in Fe transport
MVRAGWWVMGWLLAGTATVAAPAMAQDQPGRIMGRIVDAAQGLPLAGAQVELASGVAVQAAPDGRYALNDVSPGVVSVRVRMIGYQPKLVSGVRVEAGRVSEQDVALDVSVIELDEIAVTSEAERGTVERALDEQRTAVGIVNAVTADAIRRSPDSDAGQAVRRVSGVTVQDGKYVAVRGLGERYTTTQLNGARVPSPDPEKKVVPFDLFPASLLESITTTKTFTPDQWGDFSGALVNLKTREFPAQTVETFSSSIAVNSAATGQHILRAPRTGTEWLGFAGADRALPAPLAGVRTLDGRSPGEINAMIASFRNAWAPVDARGGVNGSFGYSRGGTTLVGGHELGYLAALSYGYSQEVRTDEVRALPSVSGDSLVPLDRYTGGTGQESVLWGGLLNFSTRIGDGTRLAFNTTYDRGADNEASQLAGWSEEFALPLVRSRSTFTARTVRSLQLTAEHLMGPRHVLDWSLSRSDVSRSEPDRSDLTYIATEDPASGALIPTQWFTGQFSATKTFSTLREGGWDLSGNYRLALGRLDRPVMLKTGLALRTVDRDAESQPYDIRNRDLTVAERSVPASQLFDGAYAEAGRLTLFVNQVGGRYTAQDRTWAGYAMLDLPLGRRVHLVGGARLERWALDLTSFDRTLSRDSVVTRRNSDLLPSVSLNYQLGASQQLRLSASRTLSRPEYREITDVQSFNPIDGTFLFGNPALQRASIANYDLRWEWYPRGGELVSVGVFAKQFSDPIERVFVFTSGAAAHSYINAKQAYDLGLELELRKRLDAIMPALSPVTLFANATLMRSRITPGDSGLTSAERPLVGQAGYVLNAGLTYSAGRWSGSVLYNLVGRRVAEAGFRPYPDVYEESRGQLDVSLQLPVTPSIMLKLDGKNLLDARTRMTQGPVDRLSYRTGRVVAFGAQWSP